MDRIKMIQRVEITQELIRKTKVDFWNELMVGDVLEFSRETIMSMLQTTSGPHT